MKTRLLLVEDDPGMAGLTQILLEKRGYQVDAVGTAEEALEEVRRRTPDLIISDIQLPGLSGLKLCEILKSEPRTQALPLILLTVLGGSADKVTGLRSGADDYLAKPFSSQELVARVEALLRRVRYAGTPAKTYQVKDLTVDLNRREVLLGGRPLDLRHKEYDLLVVFLQKPGQVLTRAVLTRALWGDDVVVTENTLNVHLKNLRKKLGPYGNMIQTLVGEGYKLNEDF